MTDQPPPETDAKLDSGPQPSSESPDYARALEIHIHLLRAELADERAKKSDALIAAVDDLERLTAERDAAISLGRHALFCVHHTDAERIANTVGGNCPICNKAQIQQLRAERDALRAELAGERLIAERLRDIIRRASTKFCEEGADGVIASAMFTILGEASKPNGKHSDTAP